MSVNLINLVKGQLGDSAIAQLGDVLGESAENTKNAINAGVPTILSSIAEKVANDSNAAEMLSSELDGLDPGIAVDFSGLLASDSQASLAEKGAGLLQGLFGDKLGGVTDLVSQFSGMGNKSSSSLLSMILPIVLGAINKQKRINGLDHAGVLNLLGDQKDYISQAMPSDMGDLLNSSGLIPGLGGMISAASSAVTDVAGDAVSAVTDTAAQAAGAVTDAVGDSVSAATDAISDSVSAATDAVSDSVSAATDAVSDSVSAATDSVGDSVSAATGAVSDNVSAATDSAADMANSAKDAAGNVASGVADTASQAASSGSSMVKKILPIAVIVLLVLFILKSCM